MSAGRIVVIGGGGHAKVVVSLLKKLTYTILGYTERRDRGPLLGVRYLGGDAVLGDLLGGAGAGGEVDTGGHNSVLSAVVGVGKIDASAVRLALQLRLESLGLTFPVIVSPAAVVNEEVDLGAGTVVGDGVVVNSGAVVGRACIINTHGTVEHDCVLGDNVHMAPGATLSGGVTVGANTFVGVGASVVQYVTICPDCLVGAGSTVIADISVPGVYAGTPARRIR